MNSSEHTKDMLSENVSGVYTNGMFFLIASMFFLLYAPLYSSLVDTWLNDSNHSHGLLVPFVSLYLVWLEWDEIKNLRFSVSKWGLLLLVVSLLVYWGTYIGGLVFPSRFTIVTTLAGLILFNYGWVVFKVLLFPITFLFFMVPVPDTILGLIAFPLQLFVSDVSSQLINWYGIPVYQDGNLLHFASYSFEVTEACSGIRSMYSFLCIAAFCAYLEKSSWINGVILVASAIPLATFVNLIRVTGTGLLANYFGPSVAKGFLHDFSGFVVFGLGILLMLGEIWILKKMRIDQLLFKWRTA